MKFKTNTELLEAANQIKKECAGKRPHYPILFKRAVVEYAIAQGISSESIAAIIGTANSTPYKWRQQYAEGLLSLEGAYSVSTKSITINKKIMASLKQELDGIQEKIALVERATALGLTVS